MLAHVVSHFLSNPYRYLRDIDEKKMMTSSRFFFLVSLSNERARIKYETSVVHCAKICTRAKEELLKSSPPT